MVATSNLPESRIESATVRVYRPYASVPLYATVLHLKRVSFIDEYETIFANLG